MVPDIQNPILHTG